MPLRLPLHVLCAFSIAGCVLSSRLSESESPSSSAIVAVPDSELNEGGQPLNPDNVDAILTKESMSPGLKDEIRIGPQFSGETEKLMETFVATDEWQTVQPGQAIPPGLHVSIDMQTGEKKARLMQEELGVKTMSERRKEKLTVLNEAIGKINNDNTNKNAENGTLSDLPEPISPPERIRQFVEALKEAKESGIEVKQDVEIMGEFVSELSKYLQMITIDQDAILDILDQLEGFVHHIDNAVEFYSMGGLELVTNLLGNTTVGSEIRAGAAIVLGSSCQNNPKVQHAATELDVVKKIVARLGNCDNVVEVKRLLFALSAVTRQNKLAGQEFVSYEGTKILIDILDSDELSKAHRKVIDLMYDLLLDAADTAFTEHNYGKQFTPADESDLTLLEEYSLYTRFARALVKHGLCERFTGLLDKGITDNDSAVPFFAILLGTRYVCPEVRSEVTKKVSTFFSTQQTTLDSDEYSQIKKIADVYQSPLDEELIISRKVFEHQYYGIGEE